MGAADVDSNYMNMTFDDVKKIENKRDSLFQSDDTATQIGNDLFKTGETFFAKGLKDVNEVKPEKPTEMQAEVRRSQANLHEEKKVDKK